MLDIERLNKEAVDYVIEENGDDGRYFNPLSHKQMQAFLYAPWNQAKLNNVAVDTQEPIKHTNNVVDSAGSDVSDHKNGQDDLTDSNNILSKSL